MWLDMVFFIYLLVIGIWDFKYRVVTCQGVGIGSLLVGYNLWMNRYDIEGYAIGSVIGLFFLGISKFTKEGLGYGDSVVIVLLGGYLGVQKLLCGLSLSFLMCGVCGLVLAVRLHKKSTHGIPFIPFLVVGYLGGLCG